MRVRITSGSTPLDPALAAAIRRRTLMTLATYGGRIEQVSVALKNVADTSPVVHCRVAVRMRRGERIVLEGFGGAPLETAAPVLDRAARWVRRRLTHARRRSTMPPKISDGKSLTIG
jgi:hypothetical protein